MKKESPKRGRRLPLPQKPSRAIGTKKGEKGYRRSLSREDQAETAPDDFARVKPAYEIINHTADLGIRVKGRTLEILFENAGLALLDIITNITLVRPNSKWSVSLEAENLEALLVDWLRELLYLFYGKKQFFCAFEIDELTETSLEITCWGERYDPGRHKFLTEIKAVTYHELAITREDSGWSARVIFDI